MVRLDIFLKSLKQVSFLLTEENKSALIYFINEDEIIHECFFSDLYSLTSIGGYLTRHFEVLDTMQGVKVSDRQTIMITIGKL